MRRLVIALALLVPTLAAAQQMPDPRQMSGTPRPDNAVPAGVLTVKVIAGELAAWAPVGTLVHLVAMRGNTATLTTVPVNDEGRAEFPNLATDGLTAYYVLSLYGADRLLAQPAVLPPKVGVRMMLAGRKRDKAGQPVGPAIDEEQASHEGVETAPQAVPPGVAEIWANGAVDAGGAVTVRELPSGRIVEAKLQTAGEGRLMARFTDLPPGPDHVFIAEIGGKYRSTPFMMSEAAGARRMVLVYDKLLFGLRGHVVPDEEGLRMELQMTVANLTGAPIDLGPGGLVLPLPAGFHSPVVPEDHADGFTVDETVGLVRSWPVPPGEANMIVQLALPTTDGNATIDIAAPLGIFQSEITILRTEKMAVTALDGTAPEADTASDGREYFVFRGLSVKPDDHLRINIAGLPMPPAWFEPLKVIVGLFVLAMLAVAVAFAVSRPRAAPSKDTDTSRKELGARIEKLYAELVALERARAAKRIDDNAFAAHRRSIMAKLVLCHREMDKLGTP